MKPCKTTVGYFMLISCILTLSSCAKKIQLVALTGDNVRLTEQRFFAFENDTLRISYDFFSKNGHLRFGILNKSDKPIYVHWDRSSYIVGTNYLNYYQDQYVTNGYLYNQWFNWDNYFSINGTAIHSVAKREDRTTFIPPGAELFQFEFLVKPGNGFSSSQLQSGTKNVARKGKTKAEGNVVQYNFDEQNAPVRFRNYLTFSSDQNGNDEFHVENRFWISNVYEGNGEQFFGGLYDGYYMVDNFIKMGAPRKSPWPIDRNHFVLRCSNSDQPRSTITTEPVRKPVVKDPLPQ